MNQQITPKSYREEKLKEFDITRDWVTKNFDTFWRLAEEARLINGTGTFSVETLKGTWQFIPTLAPKE